MLFGVPSSLNLRFCMESGVANGPEYVGGGGWGLFRDTFNSLGLVIHVPHTFSALCEEGLHCCSLVTQRLSHHADFRQDPGMVLFLVFVFASFCGEGLRVCLR